MLLKLAGHFSVQALKYISVFSCKFSRFNLITSSFPEQLLTIVLYKALSKPDRRKQWIKILQLVRSALELFLLGSYPQFSNMPGVYAPYKFHIGWVFGEVDWLTGWDFWPSCVLCSTQKISTLSIYSSLVRHNKILIICYQKNTVAFWLKLNFFHVYRCFHQFPNLLCTAGCLIAFNI